MDINELLELNARLSTKILDLVDELVEAKESSHYWYNEYQNLETKVELQGDEMETNHE